MRKNKFSSSIVYRQILVQTCTFDLNFVEAHPRPVTNFNEIETKCRNKRTNDSDGQLFAFQQKKVVNYNNLKSLLQKRSEGRNQKCAMPQTAKEKYITEVTIGNTNADAY